MIKLFYGFITLNKPVVNAEQTRICLHYIVESLWRSHEEESRASCYVIRIAVAVWRRTHGEAGWP